MVIRDTDKGRVKKKCVRLHTCFWPTHPPPKCGKKQKKTCCFLGFLAHLEQKKIFEVFSPCNPPLPPTGAINWRHQPIKHPIVANQNHQPLKQPIVVTHTTQPLIHPITTHLCQPWFVVAVGDAFFGDGCNAGGSSGWVGKDGCWWYQG